MSTPEWLSILSTVAGLAIGYGVLKATVASLQKELARLETTTKEALQEMRTSRDKLGERVGGLETAIAIANNELSRPHRG